MGSGKSTVGTLLAAKLDYRFIDLDQYVEDKYQKPINRIFSENGEQYFRDLESESLIEVSKIDDNCVVSTGGGVILSRQNREVMSNKGTTIYLETGLDTVWKRIKSDKTRPLLNVENSLAEAEKILSDRTGLYEQSDFTVKTDNLNAEQVADEVIKLIKREFNSRDNQ